MERRGWWHKAHCELLCLHPPPPLVVVVVVVVRIGWLTRPSQKTSCKRQCQVIR
jgi:hypothetical protein